MRLLEASVALGRLAPLALYVYQAIDAAMENGGDISASEGAEIGANLAVEIGDLRIVVRGRDILGDQAQAELGSALGRIAVRLSKALRA